MSLTVPCVCGQGLIYKDVGLWAGARFGALTTKGKKAFTSRPLPPLE